MAANSETALCLIGRARAARVSACQTAMPVWATDKVAVSRLTEALACTMLMRTR